jgi:hypothetical protein
MRLALRHPGSVAAIVGFGPPLYRDFPEARRRIARLGLLTRLFAMDNRLARTVCAWVCCLRPQLAARLAQLLRPDLPAAVAGDGVRHSWASYSGTLRHLVLEAPAPSWLERLDVPVQLVAGRKDTVVDLAFLRELEARIGPLTLTEWAGVGHDVPLADPARCLREIRSMQDRVRAPGRLPPAPGERRAVVRRSAREVLEDHLREATSGSLDADLARNYDPEVVALCTEGVFRGHGGMRALAKRLNEELPDATFSYGTRQVADDVAFLEWGAASPAGTVRDGADSYVIRDGRIVAQTIHYTVEPAAPEGAS